MSTSHTEVWNRLHNMHEQQASTTVVSGTQGPKLGSAKVRLERLVWDDRLMCFMVRLAPGEGSDERWTTVNKTAHITVGTVSADVKPKESNDLLEKYLSEGTSSNGIMELPVKGSVELEGTVRAVLSR